VIISTKFCKYWECSKAKSGKFEVSETGIMKPMFQKVTGHLMIEESRENRREINRNISSRPKKRSKSSIRV